jgi:predicted dehydrogenase
MIRVGIVDFDTSHVVEFTKRLNHVDIDSKQWVDGARIVAGVPGSSRISPERIPEYTARMKKYEVPLFDRPEDLIGKIDAVLIEAVDGSVHLERARPFLERGLPTFVDKPFACTLADARALADLAARTHAPLFSSSSLRYAPEVVEARLHDGPGGPLVGASTYGPAPLDATRRNPGLFHYGIHPVEMLFALMGGGCQSLSARSTDGADVVTGVWEAGRIGTVRGLRQGKQDYGFTRFGEKAVSTHPVSTETIYPELLKRVVAMFETGQPPLDLAQTLEIVAFMEGAAESARNGGAEVAIRV